MTGNDYLRIWYRVQIGATLVILAMMMIRNYEFNRQTVALALLIMVIILGIGLVFELLPNVSLLVKKLNAWLQVITQPIILVFAWDVMVREIIVLLHLPSRGVVTMMIFYYFIMFAALEHRTINLYCLVSSGSFHAIDCLANRLSR